MKCAIMSTRLASVVRMLPLLGFAAWAQAADQNSARSALGSGASPLGSAWSDAARMPDFFAGTWMTFEPMIDTERPKVPYTNKALTYVARYQPRRDMPYAEEGCRTPGLPIAMRTAPIKFSYAPGLISIYMQGTGHTRFIRLNQPQGRTSPKYYGNSVAHWEGDTLVVDTQDFLPEITFQYGVGKGLPPTEAPGAGPPPVDGKKVIAPNMSTAIWGPPGPNMHMVERMRLLDADTLEMKLTVYDDSVWTKPYQSRTRTWRRIRKGISEVGPFTGEPEEWICTVSITSFDRATNSYIDKDPEEMVKMLDRLGR